MLAAVYRRWGVFALTVIAVALSDWSATGLRALIERPRPPVRYPEPKTLVPVPHDASFPSGHAATSFAAATMLSFAFPRLTPFSRVYVGVHYPLDVIAGAALGVVIGVGLRLFMQQRLNRAVSRTCKAGS